MVFQRIRTTHAQFANATISIGIQIDGESTPCPEYTHPLPSSSFVQTTLNTQYSIVFNVQNANNATVSQSAFCPGSINLSADVIIDGKRMASSFLFQRGITKITGQTLGQQLRRFQFIAPDFVDVGGLTDKEGLGAIGTIQVKLWFDNEVLSGPPTELLNLDSGIDSNAVQINEKAKKGVFVSATTKLGPSVSIQQGTSSSRRITIEPFFVHTFYYKTRQVLELEGVIERGLGSWAQQTRLSSALNETEKDDADGLGQVHVERKKLKLDHAERGIGFKLLPSKPQERRGGGHENKQEDEVEYIGMSPRKEKVIELVDLTGGD
ncbi:UNVERIFIED_CONTAM: hypothetical protein HDU68_007175 [Siphonaria sp. JEL0065]|nr:hypothetical protein HDU68_007175 [Siphonaria sp. JEL0065]